MASLQSSRFANFLAKRKASTRQLDFDAPSAADKATDRKMERLRPKRSSKRRLDGVDLTRLTSSEAIDFIDGVDPAPSNSKQKTEKNLRDSLKKVSEKEVNAKVASTSNIFSANEGKALDTNQPPPATQTDTNNSDLIALGQNGTENAEDNRQSKSPENSVLEAADKAQNSDKDVTQTQHSVDVQVGGAAEEVNSTSANPENSKSNPASGLSNSNSDDFMNDDIHSHRTCGTQTDNVFVSNCGCDKCFSIIENFELFMDSNKLGCCGKQTSNSQGNSQNSKFGKKNFNASAASMDVSRSGGEVEGSHGEEMVPLVKGCPQVLVPISKKAALNTEVPDGDPKKIIQYILSCLFTTIEMAQMTFDGKTSGCKKMDSNIASVMQVFVKAKMSQDYIFDKTVLKEVCNETFYAARRWVWANRPDLVGTVVRAKMTKNKRKSDDNTNAPERKKSRASNKKSKYLKPQDKATEKHKKKKRSENVVKENNKNEKMQKSKRRSNDREVNNIRKSEKKKDKTSKKKHDSPMQQAKKLNGKDNGRTEKGKKNAKEVPKKSRKDEKQGGEGNRPTTGEKRPKPLSEDVLQKMWQSFSSTPKVPYSPIAKQQKVDNDEDSDVSVSGTEDLFDEDSDDVGSSIVDSEEGEDGSEEKETDSEQEED